MSTIHNPVNFDPADYVVVDYLDNRAPNAFEFFMGLGGAEAAKAIEEARAQYNREFARYFGWSTVGGYANVPHDCQHCGHKHIRYVIVALYQADKDQDGEYIAFGETCAERIELDLDTFRLKKLHDVAAKRLLTIKLGGKYERLLAENPPLTQAFKFWSDRGDSNSFIYDVKLKAMKYGELSEAQIDAVVASVDRELKWEAKKAAQIADEPDPKPIPSELTEGRHAFTGAILGTKMQETGFGETLKMVFLDDRGFKLWGTVPSGLDHGSTLKGERVTFMATIEQSDDDECFGFFKRPTKAEYL